MLQNWLVLTETRGLIIDYSGGTGTDFRSNSWEKTIPPLYEKKFFKNSGLMFELLLYKRKNSIIQLQYYDN